MPYDYETLQVAVDAGVARVTIDHPPINLFDLQLMLDLSRCSEELATDESVRGVLARSANPEFFIAHADVELILQLPREPRDSPNADLGFFHAMCDRFRTMPKATIAVIEGRVEARQRHEDERGHPPTRGFRTSTSPLRSDPCGSRRSAFQLY